MMEKTSCIANENQPSNIIDHQDLSRESIPPSFYDHECSGLCDMYENCTFWTIENSVCYALTNCSYSYALPTTYSAPRGCVVPSYLGGCPYCPHNQRCNGICSNTLGQCT